MSQSEVAIQGWSEHSVLTVWHSSDFSWTRSRLVAVLLFPAHWSHRPARGLGNAAFLGSGEGGWGGWQPAVCTPSLRDCGTARSVTEKCHPSPADSSGSAQSPAHHVMRFPEEEAERRPGFLEKRPRELVRSCVSCVRGPVNLLKDPFSENSSPVPRSRQRSSPLPAWGWSCWPCLPPRWARGRGGSQSHPEVSYVFVKKNKRGRRNSPLHIKAPLIWPANFWNAVIFILFEWQSVWWVRVPEKGETSAEGALWSCCHLGSLAAMISSELAQGIFWVFPQNIHS